MRLKNVRARGDIYGDFPEYRRKVGWPEAHMPPAPYVLPRHSLPRWLAAAATALAGLAGLLLAVWLIYRTYSELTLKSPTTEIETPSAVPTAPH